MKAAYAVASLNPGFYIERRPAPGHGPDHCAWASIPRMMRLQVRDKLDQRPRENRPNALVCVTEEHSHPWISSETRVIDVLRVSNHIIRRG